MTEAENKLTTAVSRIMESAVRAGMRVETGESLYDQIATNLAELPASDQRDLLKELRLSLGA